MRKFVLIPLAVLGLAAALVATSAASATTNATPLRVVMADPGCHWFYMGGGPDHRKFARSVTRVGPVTLQNLDEAALIIKGPGGTKTDPVGAKLTLTVKGVYHITMVKQAPDDNHLLLKIK